MKIHVEVCGSWDVNQQYYAIDEDTYDGAPDSHPRARLIGYGATPTAAALDLVEQIKEYDGEHEH